MTFELTRVYPGAAAIPRVALADLPTPLEAHPSLAAELGLRELWIKRDDRAGSEGGGNKVRKLELLLGRALAEGRREVVAFGPIGSHHVLATCLYARKLGLEPSAIHIPQPISPHVREVLADLAATRPSVALYRAPLAGLAALALRRARARTTPGRGPLVIPPGGSSPLSSIGYASAALELARQLDEGGLPYPDAIVVPAGTCGTLAGLALGCKLAGMPTRVVGVRAVPRALANRLRAAALARNTARILARYGVPAPRSSARAIRIVPPRGDTPYGIESPATRIAAAAFANAAGLDLDPAYTAKTVAALGEIFAGAPSPPRVLYWHTLSRRAGCRPPGEDPRDHLPAAYRAFFKSA